MDMQYADRTSSSPYVDLIMHGQILQNTTHIRPATNHWHMVFSNHEGKLTPLLVGPWTTSGEASMPEGAEIMWVRFKVGTYFRQMPTRKLVDTELLLPDARRNTFWFNSTTWEIPDFENVDTFLAKLAQEDILMTDPIVDAALKGQLVDASPRTVRHRFLQSTGLSQGQIIQLERAQQAMSLLEQGTPILDVVDQVGYSDQPHLTRSLKRFIGFTPAQVRT